MIQWTKEKDDELIRGLNGGKTPKQMAKQLGINVQTLYVRSNRLRKLGVQVKTYARAPYSGRSIYTLEQLIWMRDSPGSATDKLMSYLSKYPDANHSALGILGLIGHKSRLLEQIEKLSPKIVPVEKIVELPCTPNPRLLEKTEAELLTEILNELRILNSYAAQPKKQS